MPKPPHTFMTLKGKGKTALLAKESKAEMAKNQTTQRIDMLRALMKKAHITEGELDSGVKLLEDARQPYSVSRPARRFMPSTVLRFFALPSSATLDPRTDERQHAAGISGGGKR